MPITPTPCYVFDLDGTLANLDHRLHFIHGQSPPDWRAFFAAVADDEPIPPIVKLFTDLAGANTIVIVSGRSDECHAETGDWLFENSLFPTKLYMRRSGDHRPDHIVKRELLDQILADGYEPTLFIDDRKQVVDMWRSLGYTCLQCAEGDF